MLDIKTILHSTDFSEQSGYALGLACALCRDYNARLVVLHVYHQPVAFVGEGLMPPLTDEIRAEADVHLRELTIPLDERKVERRLIEGDAATEICSVARDVGADLIVLGTHGRTGFERLVMGSVAEHVVRQSACPVLTVSKPLATAAVKGDLSPAAASRVAVTV